MGLVYADIEMKNSFDVMLFENGNIKETEIKKINVSAMVDSGATMLSISENVCKKLGLKIKETRNSQLADGTVIEVGVTGPIELHYMNRWCNVDALVLPANTETQLGTIPLEYMDLLIDPARNRLIINPEHPDKAQMSLKYLR